MKITINVLAAATPIKKPLVLSRTPPEMLVRALRNMRLDNSTTSSTAAQPPGLSDADARQMIAELNVHAVAAFESARQRVGDEGGRAHWSTKDFCFMHVATGPVSAALC